MAAARAPTVNASLINVLFMRIAPVVSFLVTDINRRVREFHRFAGVVRVRAFRVLRRHLHRPVDVSPRQIVHVVRFFEQSRTGNRPIVNDERASRTPPRVLGALAQATDGQLTVQFTLLQDLSADPRTILRPERCRVHLGGAALPPLPSPIGYARVIMSVNFRELEEGLSRLDSVDAARVINQGDKITEIHVIAASDKPTKQIARDVQSLAMARFGLPIDHRVISVVQINPEQLDLSVVARAALMGVSESPNGVRTTIKVTLRYEDEEHVGTATGPAVASARLRLVGEATIDAIEKTFDAVPPIALDSITKTHVGSHDVIVAIVVAAGARGGEDLNVGSAVSLSSDDDAGVRAVLNALNRRLSSLGE